MSVMLWKGFNFVNKKSYLFARIVCNSFVNCKI